MAYNVFTKPNLEVLTGVSVNSDVQIGAPEKMFFTPENFSFANKAAAILQATWTAGIVAQDILPIPFVEEYTDNSEKTTYYVSPITKIATKVREGKFDITFKIKFDPALYIRLRALNGTQMRMLWVDGSNHVVGTSPDGTAVKGILSGTIEVEMWETSTGDNLSFIPVRFVAESSTERNDQVAIFDVAWNIKGLNGVQPVTITPVTSIATLITVDITITDDAVPLEGLTAATQFSLLKASDGTAQTIATVTPSATIPGRYALAGTGLVTGTLSLANAVTASLTTQVGSQFYKATTPATITI